MENLEIKKLDEAGFEQFFNILSMMSAWVDDKVAGFIVFLETYATFDARPIMYIEDLFLLEEYRGQGIGKMLFEKAMSIAKERGYSRIELLAFGEGPGKFYEKFGFKCEEQNHHYRKFL